VKRSQFRLCGLCIVLCVKFRHSDT
jgi:hypothetical protein